MLPIESTTSTPKVPDGPASASLIGSCLRSGRRGYIDPQAGLGWTGLHPRVYLLSARLPHRLAASMDARPGRGVGDHGYGKLARKH